MAKILNIQTLADLTFQTGDILVSSLSSYKAEALLVYLAVERNTTHRRESLFTLLWPQNHQAPDVWTSEFRPVATKGLGTPKAAFTVSVGEPNI